MSETPLSDLMANYVEASTPENYTRFLEAFRSARLGVVASGAPRGTAGDVQSTREHPLSLGLTRHVDGQPMTLAFADPQAFIQRFGAQCNAEMTGEALLQTALHNPECQGVLVNSAKTETAMVIDRQSAQYLLGLSGPPAGTTRKPWWKFW